MSGLLSRPTSGAGGGPAPEGDGVVVVVEGSAEWGRWLRGLCHALRLDTDSDDEVRPDVAVRVALGALAEAIGLDPPPARR
jgi:hypothetical protein